MFCLTQKFNSHLSVLRTTIYDFKLVYCFGGSRDNIDKKNLPCKIVKEGANVKTIEK